MTELERSLAYIKQKILDDGVPTNHVIHVWNLGMGEYMKEIDLKGVNHGNT